MCPEIENKIKVKDKLNNMVETRAQKRKMEENEFCNINDTTNIQCNIKKKKPESPSSCAFNSEIDMETESEMTLESDISDIESCISDMESGISEIVSDIEYGVSNMESSESNDEKDVLEKRILNMKFEPKQFKEIIKNSISTLIKRYSKEGKDFLNLRGDSEYDEFHELVESIYDGNFFERVPLEDRKKHIKDILSKEDIKKFTEELYEIKSQYTNNSPSIIDILRMNVSVEQKQKLLEKVHCLVNSEVLTPEYNSNLKFLTSNISNENDPDLVELEEQILKSSLNNGFAESYRTKILKSNMSFENKVIAYKKLEIMETYEETDTSEYAKYKAWMDTLLSVPFGIYNESGITSESSIEDIQKYIKHVRNTLDRKLSFLEKPKDQIINIVTQMIRNPDVNINAIGLHGPAGVGKCHGKDTPILMYDGSIKIVQDIQIGEIIMGDDSTPRTVLSLGRGRDTMYKITNVKSESYTTNSEHILCLKYSGNKRIVDDKHNKRFRVKWFDNKKYKVMTKDYYYSCNKLHMLNRAKEYMNSINEDKICEISVKDYLKLAKHIQCQLKGYSTGVEFQEKDIFDPYIIGLWLGDGKLSNSSITNKDFSILHYLSKTLPQYNCYLKYNITKDNSYIYRINGKNVKGNKRDTNMFLNVLRDYDLINNRHIPLDYKCNSRKNRLKLLAGLLDSNGYYYSKNNIFEISQSLEHEKLIDDIIYVCRSLGFACYKNIKKTNWMHNGVKKYRNVWRLNITGDGLEKIPTLCKRKQARPRKQIKDVLVSGIKVEELPEDNYYGFELDNNHRYILGNFIVTHNTSIVASIAEALGRPYATISLGGESDASSLTGHGFTYVGSGSGRLIDILRHTKTMNPIVLIDELDKVSETQHGKEIIGTLIHLTDSTTNSKYNYDKYFSGIEFDLSKVLFVFTYNDPTKVDRILADRLFKIKVENYDFKEKMEITTKHIIPSMIDKFKFNMNDIQFSDESIRYLVNSSNKSHGMRNIKTKIKIILSRINTLLLTNEEDNVIHLKYKKLYSYYKQLPVIIPDKHIDIFLDESITNEKTDEPPHHMYI